MLSSNAYNFFYFVEVTTRYIELPKCPRFTEMPDENTEMPLKNSQFSIIKDVFSGHLIYNFVTHYIPKYEKY